MSHCTGTDALSKVKAGSYRCHVGGGRADRGGAFVRSLVMVRREPPTGGSCLFARRPCNPHHRCEPTRLNLVAPYVRSAHVWSVHGTPAGNAYQMTCSVRVGIKEARSSAVAGRLPHFCWTDRLKRCVLSRYWSADNKHMNSLLIQHS